MARSNRASPALHRVARMLPRPPPPTQAAGWPAARRRLFVCLRRRTVVRRRTRPSLPDSFVCLRCGLILTGFVVMRTVPWGLSGFVCCVCKNAKLGILLVVTRYNTPASLRRGALGVRLLLPPPALGELVQPRSRRLRQLVRRRAPPGDLPLAERAGARRLEPAFRALRMKCVAARGQDAHVVAAAARLEANCSGESRRHAGERAARSFA